MEYNNDPYRTSINLFPATQASSVSATETYETVVRNLQKDIKRDLQEIESVNFLDATEEKFTVKEQIAINQGVQSYLSRYEQAITSGIDRVTNRWEPK